MGTTEQYVLEGLFLGSTNINFRPTLSSTLISDNQVYFMQSSRGGGENLHRRGTGFVGGEASQVIVTDSSSPRATALVGSNILWSDSDVLRRLDTTTGEVSDLLPLLDSGDYAKGIDGLYYTSQQNGDDTYRLVRVLPNNRVVTVMERLAEQAGELELGGIDASPSQLFVTARRGNEGELTKATRNGFRIERLLETEGGAEVLVQGERVIYASNDGAFTMPVGCPPEMTRIALGGSTPFCMDNVEVSVAEFERFVDRNPANPASCSLAAGTGTGSDGVDCNTNRADALPITCVDRCNSELFCESQGLRLCTPDEFDFTCDMNGAQGLPLAGDTCATDIGSVAEGGCNGPFLGLKHLVGNARELVCDGSVCESRGAENCSDSQPFPAESNLGAVGFRCCVDAP